MARRNSSYPAVLAVGALLTGCSSGGGGPASPAAAPVPVAAPVTTSGIAINLQPANTTVVYQAAATNAAGQGSSTLTLTTDASGNLKTIVFNLPGISGPYSAQSASLTSPLTVDARQVNQLLGETVGFANTSFYTLSQVAGGQTLSASAFGVWANNFLLFSGGAGGFAFGNVTPAASVPATGSATFNGSVTGIGIANEMTAYGLEGKAQMVANFSSQSVTTNLTNLVTRGSSTGSLPDLTGTSAISGNAYSGPITGGGVAGTISGNFYGATSSETAGVFQGSGAGNVFWGSYGAK